MSDLTTFGHSIDRLDRPAMIIDVERAQICNANASAKALWGLDDAAKLPICLDRSMPAFNQLAAAKGDAAEQLLVFWTAKGSQSHRCSLEQLSKGHLLVIFNDLNAAESQFQDDCRQSDNRSEAAEPVAVASRHVDLRTMAHELRTPMAAVIALAEMIEREQFGPVGDDRYREYARDIGDSARLTLSIVASALDNDTPDRRMLPGGFAEINVRELVRKCYRTVRQTAAEAGVVVETELDQHLPKLIANGPALTQILLNLLTNAIKFTPEGGVIAIEGACDAGGSLILSVRDNGVGMTGADARVLVVGGQSDLRRDDADAEGKSDSVALNSGIGFSLVRRLADAMDATIDVTSTRGVGTTVSVSFPRAKVIPIATSIPGR
jgi:signal transduction histidine kinase